MKLPHELPPASQAVEVAEKPWWESTTLWINLAGVAAIALETMSEGDFVTDPGWVALIVAVLNILNRLRASPANVKKLTV